MSFDGIVTRNIAYELKCILNESKVDKIYQQEKDEILIHLRKLGKNYKLLISASSNNPRIYLTENSKQNPSSPPMFCMLMRKHLIGGIITDIYQYELDRIISIDIKSMDEMGELSTKHLIIEIMGKHSNIILVDKSSKVIIDSIKRVSADMSRVRQVLPGLKYNFPPSGDKVNPIDINFNIFSEKINNSNGNIPVFKFLYTNFIGLSPLISREICYRSSIDERKTLEYLDDNDKEKLYHSFKSLMNDISLHKYDPNIVYHVDRDEILAFHSLTLTQYGDMTVKQNPSISYILDKYYYNKDLIDRIGQKSLSMKKSIQVKLDRALKKLVKQKEELAEAKNREHYKIYGDLISSNIYKISKGMDSIELENFYTENMEKTIVELDPKLSPSENAQKNYKKYAKLKNAAKLLKDQIIQNESEIEYLENVLISIDNCTEIDELEEIKEELINEGYIKGSNKSKKKNTKSKISKPHHFISCDNFHIYVGKNNVQNDYLTLRFANKDDLWLHTKDIPGSHVIIRTENREIPDSTLYEGALLSAFYSKAKNSQNVPVDYTYKKNVKKPNGAKPGMVIYENNNTLFINPSKSEIDKIKKVEN